MQAASALLCYGDSMRHFASIFMTLIVSAQSGFADVNVFTNSTQWQSAVGDYSTIDFTGFSNNTVITDQYEDMGILFTDGLDFIYHNNNIFLNDGIGLRGGIPHSITIDFTVPIQWIAMDFPGRLWVELYFKGRLTYNAGPFGSSGPGHFAGFQSTQPFDKVRLFNAAASEANIDDLHFGPPIPAPGVLALAATGARRRRRHP